MRCVFFVCVNYLALYVCDAIVLQPRPLLLGSLLVKVSFCHLIPGLLAVFGTRLDLGFRDSTNNFIVIFSFIKMSKFKYLKRPKTLSTLDSKGMQHPSVYSIVVAAAHNRNQLRCLQQLILYNACY